MASDGIRRTLQNRVTAGQSYAIRAWDPVTDLYSSSSSSSSNVVLVEAPTAVELIEIHGSIGLTLTMPNPVTVTWTNGTQTTGVPQNTLFSASSDLMKSMWNVFLVEEDGSGGAHNPSFATDVLYQTQVKINAWRAAIP